jgi:hypothetical protein
MLIRGIKGCRIDEYIPRKGGIEESWPVEMMIRRFVEIVEATALSNMLAVDGQSDAFIDFSEMHRVTNQLCRSSSD